MKRQDQSEFSYKMVSFGYAGIAITLLLLFLKSLVLHPDDEQYITLPDDNERNMLHNVYE